MEMVVDQRSFRDGLFHLVEEVSAIKIEPVKKKNAVKIGPLFTEVKCNVYSYSEEAGRKKTVATFIVRRESIIDRWRISPKILPGESGHKE